MGVNSRHHQQQQRMRQSHQQQQELLRQSHQQQLELLRQSHQQQQDLLRQLHHQQQQQVHHLSPQLKIHVPEVAAGPMQPQKLTRNQKTKRRFTYMKRLQKRAEKRELEKEGNWILF